MNKRFFVAGLCLQGNKGGPAIALSLMDSIRKEMGEVEFVFAVPSNKEEWLYEVEWAKKYDVEIVREVGPKHFVPPYMFMSNRFRELKNWCSALLSSNAMIEMSAISYVGPPSGNGKVKDVILSGRFRHFFLSFLLRKKMLAWTQSYGPLSSKSVRFFAKFDLRRQPVIFCRGDDCQQAVRKLLPNKKTFSFPDVAVSLSFDRDWGKTYIESLVFGSDKLVTLSPSAVLYKRAAKDGGMNSHVEFCVRLCLLVESLGFHVLLVPHTLRPSNPGPKVCDLAVSKLVESCVKSPNVKVVTEDLSPIELKSVISNAEMHFGARYHSVVAAVSSGVPAMAMSWHPKYKDILRGYGAEGCVLAENNNCDESLAFVQWFISNHKNIRDKIAQEQDRNLMRIIENRKLFCDLLTDS